ncbi:MAG: N-acetylmuramoyl-L-alanine amidase [Candidatus Cryptobacteroides sp.]
MNTVVIDPGHGGKDAGCSSPDGKVLEKDIVLDIGKRLADKIRKGYPEMKVILTRDSDKSVELQQRAEIANRNKANLFISIHVNSVEGKRSSPNGYSIHILGQYTSKNRDLYAVNMDVVRRENSVITLEDDFTTKYEGFDPSDEESYIFMNLMQNAFLEQSLEFAQHLDRNLKGGPIKNSRGISQDPFLVLWRTAMPSVLIECGFMPNPQDRAALNSEEGREGIAAGIYEAFKNYKKGYDGTDAADAPASVKESRPASARQEKAPEKNPEQSSAREGESAAAAQETPAAVLYGTQVLVSSKEVKESDPYFLGYTPKSFRVGKLYKYVIGIKDDPESAKSELKKIRAKYPDAFLVKIEENNVSVYK